MKTIRCGRGLGDSLYLQAVVRHMVKTKGVRLKPCSDWPDVFRPLGNSVEVIPFSRSGIQIIAHYSARKSLVGTTQFEDCCSAAGIQEPVELKLDWPQASGPLVDKVKAPGKPIVCVQLPRWPMDRPDGFGKDLLPDCGVIQKVIDALGGRFTVVQIGAGQPLHKFSGIDIDLANKTTVRELLDVASVAAGFLGYCSFMVPLAESFDRPALFVWSSRGLQSCHPFINTVKPEKLLHKPSSKAVMDTATQEEIDAAAREFAGAIQ